MNEFFNIKVYCGNITLNFSKTCKNFSEAITAAINETTSNSNKPEDRPLLESFVISGPQAESK